MGVQAIVVVRAQRQELAVTGPTVSVVWEQRAKDANVHPGFSIQSRTLALVLVP